MSSMAMERSGDLFVDLAGNEMEENAERIARQSTLGIVFRLRPEEVATDAYRAKRDELIGRINDALADGLTSAIIRSAGAGRQALRKPRPAALDRRASAR